MDWQQRAADPGVWRALAQAHPWACTPTHEHRGRARDSERLPLFGYPHSLASRVGPCLRVCLPVDPSAGAGSEDSGSAEQCSTLALSGLPAALPGLSCGSPWRRVGGWLTESILYLLLCSWLLVISPRLLRPLQTCVHRHLPTLQECGHLYQEAGHPGWESLSSEPSSLTHRCSHGHGSLWSPPSASPYLLHPWLLPCSCCSFSTPPS